MIRLLALGIFTLFVPSLPAQSPKYNQAVLQQLLSSPQGQQMLRQAGHQEAEEARRHAAREEQQRQRTLADKDQLRRQAFQAQLHFSPRLATARALEIARWASSGFTTPFTCDLHFNCVQWQSLSQQQASATSMDLKLPTPIQSQTKPDVLLGSLSVNRKLR